MSVARISREQLAEALRLRVGDIFSSRDITRLVRAFEDIVTETVAAGDELNLLGFGTFRTKDWPRQKPRRRLPEFAPGTRLKEAALTGKVPSPPDQRGGVAPYSKRIR